MNDREGFLNISRQRILIMDGGMGSQLFAAGLNDGDYGGHPGCHEFLCLSRPDVIQKIHTDYLSAGAQIIETDSFGGARHILAEHGLADRCFEINQQAARLAKQAAGQFSQPDEPRYAAGSMGPGSKLPGLGQISFDELVQSYLPQAQGLLAGGVDCFIVETCQDLLQLKAAVIAIDRAMKEQDQYRPIIGSVTIDQSGRTLLGSDIAAVLAALEPLPLAAIGLNCSLGPKGLTEAVYYLARHSSKPLFLMPNAGLPKLADGRTVYDLEPKDFAGQMKSFASAVGLNIAGGCCGTTPEHIRELASALKDIPARQPLETRTARISSLYQSQDISTEPKPLIIGERTNVTGSKLFRECLQKDDYEGMMKVALNQQAEQSHAIDLSLAAAGRQEVLDYQVFCSMLNTRLQLPVMIDSTSPQVVEEALKRLAGRCIVNSVNLEDGEKRARETFELCRQYGAAVVCLTIDELGMADTADRKIAVAQRLQALALECGLSEQDLLFDFLTFSLGSGDESLKSAGKETLDAITKIKSLFPNSHTVLGISNISYGLAPQARKALNSVFLRRAVERGLDAAIMHAGRIMPLHLVPPQLVKLCDDLILNRQTGSKPPLEALLAFFSHHKIGEESVAHQNFVAPAQRLEQHVLSGDSQGLEQTLKALLKEETPLFIIREDLLPAMDKVGKLFGQGKLQLPFVLRSAEVMRSASDILKPMLGKKKAEARGSIVLATVRGDIHDIGKNLVAMILEANGFKVINLGVKQSAEQIISAVKEHQPTAVGLSGLLVESVKAMTEYLEVFKAQGLSLPVICGGAALSQDYYEKTMLPLYPGVHFAKDAMDGLKVMQQLTAPEKPVTKISAITDRGSEVSEEKKVRLAPAKVKPETKPEGLKVRASQKKQRLPFEGSQVEKKIPLYLLLEHLNRRSLYQSRWQMVSAKADQAKAGQQAAAAETAFNEMWEMAIKKDVFKPKAVYGFYRARWKGYQLVVLKPKSQKEWLTLTFSEKIRGSIPAGSREELTVALQLVTLGRKVSKRCRKLNQEGKVQKEFLLHGLAAELTEALAKWNNARINKLAGWENSIRLSPGYPVWPKLAQQEKIFSVLKPVRIKVKLSESHQMDPEFSTSAIIFCKD
ncbi:homocysteine S-methyltransferase family protein [candidate division TA06 bacterium]|nr:homocysteine S-methyltransferase family protein [candidate division TA06 bacterium]